MDRYDIYEACEAYRKAWLMEIAIYIVLMTLSGVIGYCFGAASC